MMQSVKYLNKEIVFKHIGKGPAITLLHGYLESKEIWNEFALELAKKFSVCLIDLPGHGKSASFFPMNTMEIMAESVNAVLNFLNIEKTFLIGHSMGGYAALAFAEKYPNKLWAFSLFHSAPFADNQEKKQNRYREIKLLNEGKKELIYSAHFPKIFAPANVEQFADDIENAKQIAALLPPENIVATLKGLKDRKDRTQVMNDLKVPFIFFAGKFDQFIPYDLRKMLPYPLQYHIVELENSGHIGFIEELSKSVNAINTIAKLYS
jgi:pimeloyl-ACP methyl ester carboxylesterase